MKPVLQTSPHLLCMHYANFHSWQLKEADNFGRVAKLVCWLELHEPYPVRNSHFAMM
jgi:hypothetical protein